MKRPEQPRKILVRSAVPNVKKVRTILDMSRSFRHKACTDAIADDQNLLWSDSTPTNYLLLRKIRDRKNLKGPMQRRSHNPFVVEAFDLTTLLANTQVYQIVNGKDERRPARERCVIA